MTECVCEFKRPRSSSLGQCTSDFVLLRTILLTYTHFHKLTCTHTFNKSVGESVFCTLKVYLYYCQDNLESFIHLHLCICQTLLSKTYTWEPMVLALLLSCSAVSATGMPRVQIYRHAQTQKNTKCQGESAEILRF